MLAQPLMTLSTFFIKHIHGGDNFALAIIQMIMQGGMILGALIPFFKKRWKNKMRILFIGMIVINIGYLMYALAPIGFYPLIGAGAFITKPIALNALAVSVRKELDKIKKTEQ